MNGKWLPVISGLFVGVLLISNIASVKLVNIWSFTFDGGTILFPLSYIFGDILTEVYGYKASRKVIWTGFLSAGLMAISLYFVANMQAPVMDEWGEFEESAFDRILAPVGRIVIASLIAFLAGEFSNSYILAKLKIKTHGRFLFLRTISSTLVGQGIDTAVFCLLAFYGTMPNEILIAVIVSNYIFKCSFEILATPLTYAVVIGLKKSEGVDVYDVGTDFNPFKVFSDARGV